MTVQVTTGRIEVDYAASLPQIHPLVTSFFGSRPVCSVSDGKVCDDLTCEHSDLSVSQVSPFVFFDL